MPVPVPVISSNIILTREPVPAAAHSYWYDSKAPVLVPLTHGYEIILKKTNTWTVTVKQIPPGLTHVFIRR